MDRFTEAQIIMRYLRMKSYECFVCGGYVRDYLLKRETKDIDLATSAKPEEAKAILEPHYKIIDTGLKHGTITVVGHCDNYELTTYRLDKKCDGRHADVEYTTNLEKDSQRRDFTINALYMGDSPNDIISFGTSIDDIFNKRIKFVGNAEDRIKEDYLRIMRYYRFMAILNFKGSREEIALTKKYKKQLLEVVSKERIRDELLKILTGTLTNDTLRPIFWVLPILKKLGKINQPGSYHKNMTVLTHTIQGLNNTIDNKKILPITRLAFLLHDIGKITKGEVCERTKQFHAYGHEKAGVDILTKYTRFLELPLSNKDRDLVYWLIEKHMERINFSKGKVCMRLIIESYEKFGTIEPVEQLLYMFEMDLSSRPNRRNFEVISLCWAFFQNKLAKYAEKKPKCPIDGHEIIEIIKSHKVDIVKHPKLIGELKNKIWDLIKDEKLAEDNKREAEKIIHCTLIDKKYEGELL